MKTFRKLNNLLGWIVFAFASWVYLSTIEPIKQNEWLIKIADLLQTFEPWAAY